MSDRQGIKQKAFTLIELLVVIAIIGLLSSIVLVSLNSARKKARDTKRIADFRNFTTAMELYFHEHDRYPPSPNRCCSGGDGGTHNQNFETVAQALVDEGYMASVPEDPSSDAGRAYMLYNYGPNNPIGYITVTYLEGIEATTEPLEAACRPFTNNWCSNTRASTAHCVCHSY